ncbi:MAG: primosomal protein N', partial [Bacteroidota bacterium]
PEIFEQKIAPGCRVVVQFGKRKIYTAVVIHLHNNTPTEHEPKAILTLLDENPVVVKLQLQFIEWISSYYLCHQGEVLNAMLPSALKVASESKITINPDLPADFSQLNEKEQLLLEALHYRKTIEVEKVAGIVGQQKVIPIIKTLIEKGYVMMEEEVQQRYKPKSEIFIRLTETYSEDESQLALLFDQLEKRAKKQLEVVMGFYHLSRMGTEMRSEIPRAELTAFTKSQGTVIDNLIKKGVFEEIEKEVSRLETYTAEDDSGAIELSEIQQGTLDNIKLLFLEKDVVLLHGVTSSGKTEIYIKLIREMLDQGKQVLYLLPEIALTGHIIHRLKRYFGNQIGVSHSRFNESERVEIWNKVLNGADPACEAELKYDVVLGARSAIFLPFTNLGLVIVDEEHDPSFKQFDPAPRYNARDSAIYLAHLHGAKTLLGSATPSIESYFNATEGKYGLAEIHQRYGNMELPEVNVVNVREEVRWHRMKSHFSPLLIKQVTEALQNGEQAILFQNRRGFSLRIECETCQWMPQCRNCDVTLVYHKKQNQLRCHYCGYTTRIPDKCPECKGTRLKMKGFGTEKVEEELSTLFPDARITRMDLD